MTALSRKVPSRYDAPELTGTQEKVARLIGDGLTYEAIGELLGMKPGTARAHANAIADKLPNPHNLPAQRLVRAWLTARDFLRQA